MHMFLTAEPVVKAVMIILAAASVLAWSILIVMFARIAVAKARVRRSIQLLSHAGSLGEAEAMSAACDAADLMHVAIHEARLSNGLPVDGAIARVSVALHRQELAVSRRVSGGLGVLAIIGSTGPFVGLFGTVWGIMHSFISIANSHTTNLSVVAPGIAEALLATAIGLVAAIPAVIFYNLLSRQASNYKAILGDASSLILRHLSRDLDRRGMPVRHENGAWPPIDHVAGATMS